MTIPFSTDNAINFQRYIDVFRSNFCKKNCSEVHRYTAETATVSVLSTINVRSLDDLSFNLLKLFYRLCYIFISKTAIFFFYNISSDIL